MAEKTIVERIVDDARAVVNSTLEEGNAKAQETLDSARNDARIYLEKNMEETAALREEIIRRRISVANLEVKKTLLKAKKRVIDEVFAEAKRKILELPDEEYLSVIESMMVKEAVDGDTVLTSPKDASRITANFIQTVASKMGIKLSLGAVRSDIEGGIILSSGSFDKNLSVDVELAEIREEIETAVAERLFGEN